jgi:hypothetical protein
MIRYDLTCESGHRFDGWFRSSVDFDEQAAKALLACPSCGSAKVVKALMAPAVSLGAAPSGEAAEPVSHSPEAASAPQEMTLLGDKEQRLRAMLREVRDQVMRNAEDVGDRFPEVARRMHSEEIEKRSIYGKASAEEARALVEEGVEIQPLPRLPDDTN